MSNHPFLDALNRLSHASCFPLLARGRQSRKSFEHFDFPICLLSNILPSLFHSDGAKGQIEANESGIVEVL